MESELNAYYRQIRKSLCCPKRYKKKFLQDLENDIAYDLQNNPLLSYQDIVDKYGSPDQLVSSYIASLDETVYRTQSQTQKNIKKTIIICIILIMCALIGVYIMAFTYIRKATPVYYDIETTDEELP